MFNTFTNFIIQNLKLIFSENHVFKQLKQIVPVFSLWPTKGKLPYMYVCIAVCMCIYIYIYICIYIHIHMYAIKDTFKAYSKYIWNMFRASTPNNMFRVSMPKELVSGVLALKRTCFGFEALRGGAAESAGAPCCYAFGLVFAPIYL